MSKSSDLFIDLWEQGIIPDLDGDYCPSPRKPGVTTAIYIPFDANEVYAPIDDEERPF